VHVGIPEAAEMPLVNLEVMLPLVDQAVGVGGEILFQIIHAE
jgi:hypothetical protein